MTHNSDWIVKQMGAIIEEGHNWLVYSASWPQAGHVIRLQNLQIQWVCIDQTCLHSCLRLSSAPLIRLMRAHAHTHTFLSCLRCRVFLNMSLKKKNQVCRHCVSVGGSHGEATGQQSGTCLHFKIHSGKRRSLHLFKTLLMSFNTASWLPLLPPCASVGRQRLWPFCAPL